MPTQITQGQVAGLATALTSVTSDISDLTGALNTGLATVEGRLDLGEAGRYTPVTVPIVGGVLTIDLSLGADFRVPLNANISSMVYQNFPVAPEAKAWTVRFFGDGTARTVNWNAAVKHNGGTTPTIATINGKMTTFTQMTEDGGTKIHTWKSGETG